MRRVESATLLAPTTGVVDKLSVFTFGGIAEAGTELLRVVPTSIAVGIGGTLSNSDIGFPAPGQQAKIRLDAYPSERFGFLKARVTDIAADSVGRPAPFLDCRLAGAVRPDHPRRPLRSGIVGRPAVTKPQDGGPDTGRRQTALRPDVTTGGRPARRGRGRGATAGSGRRAVFRPVRRPARR